MEILDSTLHTIKDTIIDRNRGGVKGMHGFIAEVAECGIGKARQQIEGKEIVYKWINDNGPDDLMRNGLYIQQKFVNAGGHFSLNAVKEHLEKYPDYLTSGKVYQIPKDHYDNIKYLLEMPKEVANNLPTSDGEFSLKNGKRFMIFFADGSVPFEKLEPSTISYGDAQAGAIKDTISKEKGQIAEKDRLLRDKVYQKSMPTFQEGLKATVISGVIEGGTEFGIKVAQKRQTGKKIKDFSFNDWKEISVDSGKSFAKGSVRGTSIYTLTNFTATPAAVANAMVTATFGIAEQTHLFRQGKLSEIEFIENSEMLCLDVSVSALSSLIGQVVIPVPVLGAVIGNTVGNVMYQIGKNQFSDYEQKILCSYADSLKQLDDDLATQYQVIVNNLNDSLTIYLELISNAFDPDVNVAFEGSVNLAKYYGVPSEGILDSYEKVERYFNE